MDLAIPLLVIYPKKIEAPSWKDTCTSSCVAALSTTAETWKCRECPWIGEQIRKVWCTCVYIQHNFTQP